MRQPFTEVSGIARHWGFEDLASTGPVQRLTLFTGVPVQLVTGYAETRELLAHPDVVRSPLDGPHRDSVMDDLIARTEQHMLGANPPDHTRLRKLAQQAFAPRVVRALEPEIAATVDSLLDRY